MMGNCSEILIDGCPLIIENVEQMDDNYNNHHSNATTKALNWASEEMRSALRPAISIMKSIRDTAEEYAPDEMEVSMEFAVCLKGETPVFKVVSGEAQAQIAVTFSWKRE